MNHITNIILGLAIIKTKLDNPIVVTRTMLIHVPEAIISLFTESEEVSLLAYGWEIHSAEGGYMYRLNV